MRHSPIHTYIILPPTYPAIYLSPIPPNHLPITHLPIHHLPSYLFIHSTYSSTPPLTHHPSFLLPSTSYFIHHPTPTDLQSFRPTTHPSSRSSSTHHHLPSSTFPQPTHSSSHSSIILPIHLSIYPSLHPQTLSHPSMTHLPILPLLH